MTRTEILQFLINEYNYKTYLEIGYQSGINFNAIRCDHKISVDPDPSLFKKVNYNLTSDDFFKTYKSLNFKKIDCIFIDGLHEAKQVYRDIENSLDILSEGGTIVCHDMNPTSEYMQLVPRPNQRGKPWNGDCWKALIRAQRDFDIIVQTVNSDYGCSIIQKSNESTSILQHITDEDLTYEKLNNNRKQWLNLITPYQFQQNFKK